MCLRVKMNAKAISKTVINLVSLNRSRHSGITRKRCSKNMQQIYRRTPMPKRDFNEVA